VIAQAKLNSINAPKAVVTKTDGKLIKLNVAENDKVYTGEIIGYMESTANHEKVLKLSAYLDTLSQMIVQSQDEKLLQLKNITFSDIGELQQPYQTFTESFVTFSDYISNGFYLKKKQMLIVDMNMLKAQHNNLLAEKKLQEKDLSLAQKTFDMNDTLKKQKVISDLEYRNEKSKLITKQLSIPQINASIISNENEQTAKQKEILELENTIAQQRLIFQEALNTFKSAVNDWKKKYLLTASVSGTISFTTFLQENEELKANEIICYIKPANSSYYAEMFIPQSNFGKVKTGQKVLLKFQAYPDAEFGSVTGKIDFISSIPSDSGYLAKVSLPYGLITNYKKQIQFREGLIANGQIITENMRLLQRFYYNIFNQMKR
jgi:HlyD family secretion protein